MKIDLLRTHTWEDWNEGFRSEFPMKADEHGRMYRGLEHAVCEMVLGTALFFSHKPQVAIIEGETWAFEAVLPQIYKMGFQVQVIPASQLPAPGAPAADWQTWAESLPRETNFVMWAEDHPVTGADFGRELLDVALGAKRILSMAVSHSAHFFRPRDVSPYGVRIQSLSEEYAWARLGARVRTPPLFAHRMIWGANERAQVEKILSLSRREDRAAVEDAERLMTSKFGFREWGMARRLYDRVAVWHPDRNGAALAELLKRALQLPLDSESVTGCEHPVLPAFTQWWQPMPSADEVRGLLLLSPDLVRHPLFEDKLREAMDATVFELNP